jgi:hypothetical protein
MQSQGRASGLVETAENVEQSELLAVMSGGKMPRSTAGETPAATVELGIRCSGNT